MATKWQEHVKHEFIRTDRNFTEKLPINSIDISTYGLISEATTFVPVRIKGEIHIQPLKGGLTELRKDLQQSPRPGGGFEVDQALSTLAQFAEEWEEEIKKKDKWSEMVELAEADNSIVDQSQILEENKQNTGFLSKLRNIFKSQ